MRLVGRLIVTLVYLIVAVSVALGGAAGFILLLSESPQWAAWQSIAALVVAGVAYVLGTGLLLGGYVLVHDWLRQAVYHSGNDFSAQNRMSKN